MSEPLTLDPEVEAILREVAADPRSVLRMPRNLATTAFFEEDSRPTVGSTGLSSASQELLRVHRNEVAWLLRQACLVKLYGGSGKLLVSRYMKANGESPVLTRAALANRVELEARSAELVRVEHSPDAIELLSQCIAGNHDSGPTIMALAAASFRLEPTNQGRLLAAIDAIRSAQEHTGLHLANEVLAQRPTDSQRISALDCCATAEARLNRLDSAYEVYSDATAIGEEYVHAHTNRFLFALQLGLRGPVLEASRILDAVIPDQHPVLSWIVDTLSVRRRQGEWSPTTSASRLAVALDPRFGTVARNIAHVVM